MMRKRVVSGEHPRTLRRVMHKITTLGIRDITRWGTLAGGILAMACGGSKPAPASSPPPTSGVLLGAEPEIKPLPAMDVEPATTPPAPAVNPFEGAEFYRDPEYAKKVESTPTDDPAVKALLEKVKKTPTALWLDRIAAVEQIPIWLKDVKKQAKAAGKPVVPVFVVYDMPNRDCAAKASAGELDADQGGEQRYRTEFIDPIAKHFAADPKQRIVVVLEPDSLANMATNLGVEKCARSQNIYKHSSAYAIAKLSMPNVFIYMDAAHAGWLGWASNRGRAADVFAEVLEMAGGPDRIRGFATNVSNYNALEGDWGKKLESSNPTPNELAYVDGLAETLATKGITGKGYIVDTSRNGVQESRKIWGSWCNVAAAGLGPRPQIAPRPPVDAYFWVKPPGDSDGISDPSAARFDENCKSVDAAPNAPEAGQWFPEQFLKMLERANPPF